MAPDPGDWQSEYDALIAVVEDAMRRAATTQDPSEVRRLATAIADATALWQDIADVIASQETAP